MENELSIQDYLLILKRRWQQIVAVFAILIVIITIYIINLPNVFRSEGVIAIESPTISEDIIKQTYSSRYANESLDKVKEKIYTSEYLMYLNEEFNLYPKTFSEKKIKKLVSQLIDINQETRNTTNDPWGQTVIVALRVGVEYSDPETTYKMASEVINELLEENEKVRKDKVTQTTTYLNEELEKLKNELDLVEGKVADYKQKYANSLPEHQQMHMATLDQLRASLKELNREYKTTQEELRYLDVELTTTEASLTTTNTRAITKNTELEKAQAELDQLLGVYTESHPTIKALRRKIALLEKAPVTEPVEEVVPEKSGATIAAELALSKIRTQIQSAKVRLQSIEDQQNKTTAQIRQLESQILQIPQVERGLATLQRDYDNAKQKYDEVKAKQINAKIAENLALEDQSERFTLKYSPEFPKYRYKPIRTKLFLIGSVIALAISIGFALLLEMLDPRVRGQQKVSSIIGMRLLAVVPYIETATEVNKKKKVKKYLIMLSIVALLILIILMIHFFVMPLNDLLESTK